jgi:PRTRC genetic system protein C
MARKFIYEGKEYPDLDPSMKPDEVRQNMAQFFPELSNAETKEEKKGDDTIFTFKKRTGTKGGRNLNGRKWRGKKCHLGTCAVKRVHYAGGAFPFPFLLRGTCPECGGPAIRLYPRPTGGGDPL